MIIKGPEDANLIENFEGSSTQQTEAQKKIQDIETNKMYTWADMSKVKRELWNKLHTAKELMKKKAINLAQLISRNTNHLMNNYVPDNIKQSFTQMYSYTKPVAEKPVVLGQTESFSDIDMTEEAIAPPQESVSKKMVQTTQSKVATNTKNVAGSVK